MPSYLPWTILLAPVVAAIVITVGTRRFRALSAFLSVTAVLVSFVCSLLIFTLPNITAPPITWIDFPGIFTVPLGLTLDHLSQTMLLVVTGVGSLIHIYS